jgi:hypothetical protein
MPIRLVDPSALFCVCGQILCVDALRCKDSKVQARLSLSRGTIDTCRSAIARSSWRSPRASPIRTPVSSSRANKSRSRRCPHASRIGCASDAVRTRARDCAVVSLIVRRRCAVFLVT